MRVYIDARDLINIFNASEPITASELGDIISNGGHQLVMPFSLISELIPADNNLLTVLRRFTKIEEDIPHVFLQQHALLDVEMRSAAADHVAGVSPVPHDPYVTTLHELWGEQFEDDPIFLMDVERTIGIRRLSRQIELALQRPEVFHWSKREVARAVRILENKQAAMKTANAKTAFSEMVQRWARRAEVQLDAKQLSTFTALLRKDPRIAPGWRLYMEVFDQLARDRAYKPTVNDVWDLANVMILPYVDSATLDKNKVDMVKRATRRLQVFDATIDYDKRVFSSAKDLLSRLVA
jgi:hypothetical protein